ncbi:phospholipase effector Tle1 domain-containing protein [Deinococcus ruber]|uniref:T6SS Phospholipase effector Tle1-like catalytic domain-containing protein n=1 Tax=Deinococcus ruber TaxID=1848197 RepID=A0A918C9F9_9DEIO|nr:DUF2235 domain-containing protein [Deinococcus ruber]GGR11498.1 hypothetical protein GCM10008957_25450 [Deinococcus ruber]
MPKNLIVSLDGTWNSVDESGDRPTNAALIALQFVSNRNQVIFYRPGLGAGVMGMGSKMLQGATGYGIFESVRDSFRFLSVNYAPNDKIFIFGFSRGAYAARHLAGMISKFGLDHQAYSATHGKYVAYIDSIRTQQLSDVNRQDIEFLGLFDCVPGNYLINTLQRDWLFNSTALEPGIRNFRQALSIDERRFSFMPLVFRDSPGRHDSFKQIWFEGYHGDVGGGAEAHDSSSGSGKSQVLADVPLLWMLSEAHALGLKISAQRFNHTYINTILEGKKHSSDYPQTRLIHYDRRKSYKIDINEAKKERDSESFIKDYLQRGVCPLCRDALDTAIYCRGYPENRVTAQHDPQYSDWKTFKKY